MKIKCPNCDSESYDGPSIVAVGDDMLWTYFCFSCHVIFTKEQNERAINLEDDGHENKNTKGT